VRLVRGLPISCRVEFKFEFDNVRAVDSETGVEMAEPRVVKFHGDGQGGQLDIYYRWTSPKPKAILIFDFSNTSACSVQHNIKFTLGEIHCVK